MTAPQPEYRARLAAEQERYSGCTDVHQLPGIFHYWSNRYLRPQLEAWGFDGPQALFAQQLAARCHENPGVPRRFLSIGSGNCDLELDLVSRLRREGFLDFTIECLDVNPVMLDRGRHSASQLQATDHLVFTCADFNTWEAAQQYDGVIANQALHHVTALEHLFDQIRASLREGAVFTVSDMIGRNGHLRWPEALELVHKFWLELSPSYRFNCALDRYEEIYRNWDCSQEEFEGIRAQDVLPTLLDRFHFEFFFGFANIIDPFTDRAFGSHFNADNPWDRAFIDRIHARDDDELHSGRLKPTHMLAVLVKVPRGREPIYFPHPPADCVRLPRPDDALREATYLLEAEAHPKFTPEAFARNPERELRLACERSAATDTALAAARRKVAQLESDLIERTDWARGIESSLADRTAWAQQLEHESAERLQLAHDLEHERDIRTAWAQSLDIENATNIARAADLAEEVDRRTAWAQSLEADLAQRTAWARSLETDVAERTAWAQRLDEELRLKSLAEADLQRLLANPFGKAARLWGRARNRLQKNLRK